MRVLVTGSSGHVGGAIAARLRTDGHTVIGVSRHRGSAAVSDHVEIDISDPDAVGRLSKAVEPCTAIVHAAASLSHDPDAPSVSLTNCWGSQAMLAVGRAWGVESFVYLSSIGVIGLPVELPITEDHPVAPRSAYHASKRFGEHLVQIAQSDGMSAVSLRLTAPVGAGMPRGRILSVFVERARRGEALVVLGQGTRQQNYVDVRDIATAVVQCLDARATGILNIGGPSSVSNVELAQTCIEVLNSSSEVQFSGLDSEEGATWDVSTSRAASSIGYSPRYRVADAILSIGSEM